MDSKVRSWELVEHLFDASVSPERLDELIAVWDAQIEHAGPGADAAVGARRLGLRAPDRRRAADPRAAARRRAPPRQRPALVDARRGDGAVRGRLGGGGQRRRRQPLRAAPGRVDPRPCRSRAGHLDGFAERLAEIAAGPAAAARRSCGCARPGSTGRCWCTSSRMRGGDGRPHVLAVTSELAWPDAVSEFLARVFKLTPAEIEVVRLLAAGGTVAGIAAATGRRPGHRALAAPRGAAEDRHPHPGRGGASRASC